MSVVFSAVPPRTARRSFARALAFAVVAASVSMAALGAPGVALAQPAPKASSAPAGVSSAGQAQYLLDRERCDDPVLFPDRDARDACLREAAAVRAWRARGGDAGGAAADGQADDPARFQRNEALRCDPLPPELRADCLARARGGGMATGSVDGGGILRESITREISAQPPIVPVEIK